MHAHIPRTSKVTTPMPGLTSAVRGYWQSVGNAGVACQILSWVFCVFGAQPDGTVYGWIFALAGICAFLIEFYGRIRHRKKQMPYPKGYSLCRYAGFACAAAAVFVQYHLRQMTASLLLLAAGLLLVEVSILMDKAERRRLRALRELEES